MPELPEVEIVKRGLESLIVGKTIKKVDVLWPRIIQTNELIDQWKEKIVNEKNHAIHRRGKYIVFELTHYYLISHLRMEGKYYYYNKTEIPKQIDKHTHVIFTYSDMSQLHYHDVRKFGRIERIDKEELENYFQKKKLGVEPFSDMFTSEYLADKLKQTRASIKSSLLSQHIVTGLGNIYVDETLFKAKIYPLTPSNQLTSNQIDSLQEAIVKTLYSAVQAGGSTIHTYKNTFGEPGNYQQELKVYGKEGDLCINCGCKIIKTKVAQRGTHYCPRCQKLESM